MTNLIKEAQEKYDAGQPIMSDEAFDKLTNDESQFKLTEDTYTVKHYRPMGSMNKVHSEEDLMKVLPSGVYVQPKFDGISCELILENGEIKSMSTRGNGEYGKDMSHLLKKGLFFGSVWNPEIVVVYGELTLNSEEPSQKDRNVVAGIANKTEPSDEEVGSLMFNIYQAYRSTDLLVPYGELSAVYFCDSPQVKTSYTYVANTEGSGVNLMLLQGLFDSEYKHTKRDGVVFKQMDALGVKDSFEIALKPEPMSAVTTIKDVSWTKGKSKFASTAIIDPIELGGVSISRVTLPERYIREMDLCIGDMIEVTRAGDVIPKIIGKVQDGEVRSEIKPPMECPYGHTLIKVGKTLKCTHSNCEMFEKDFIYPLMEIMFWGVKRAPKSKLRKLIAEKKVTLKDLFLINRYKGNLTQNQQNLVNQGLTNFLTKDTEAKLLHAMNIDGMSFEKCKDIINEYGSIEEYAKGDNKDPFVASVKFILDNSSIVKLTIEDIEEYAKEYKDGKFYLNEE